MTGVQTCALPISDDERVVHQCLFDWAGTATSLAVQVRGIQCVGEGFGAKMTEQRLCSVVAPKKVHRAEATWIVVAQDVGAAARY